MLKRFALLLIPVLLLAACAKNAVEYTPDNKMAAADELFAKKKYARAAELYDDVSFEKKSAQSAVALMSLAECYYRMNKFTDARLKYIQMTNTYPDFTDIELAWFRIGVCYYEESLPAQYDQTETGQSIEAFRVFADKFPDSQYFLEAVDYIRKAQYKLIEKKFYNGYIYYKMQDYSSALMYFKEIIELGNTDELDRKSLYYATRISIFHDNKADSQLYWQKLRERYPQSSELKKLELLF
jgi:outer membrane protein assembly factor BamD